MYTVVEYAIAGVMEPTENYFEESNQEDFAISMLDVLLAEDITYIMTECVSVGPDLPFTLSGLKTIDSDCYYDIIENRMTLIEDEFPNIEIELRESKDVYFENNGDTYRIRVLKDMNIINKSFFVEGRAPQNNNEIAVAETFGNLNNLDVGDTITVHNKEYTISGYVLFPDYNLPMFGVDFILDNKTQTVGMLTDEEFESYEENLFFEIGGVYINGMDIETFEEDVIDKYKDIDSLDFVTNILLTENNTRSGAIYAELTGGRAYGILMSLLIASIGLMIVGIMVSRVLQSQRGPIGILKSMGYTNAQITFPYILFIAILALPTILIGYYIGLVLATPFKNVFMSFYLLPHIPITQTIETVFVAVVVPFVFVVGLSYFIVHRLLSKKPVTLLNPEVTSSSNFITKRIGKYLKKLKITSKLQHLLLYRNIVKFLVFLIGMFYAAFLILFSFSMNGLFDRMLYDYYENTEHEYIAFCEYTGPCEVKTGMEKVIEMPSALLDDEDVILTGLNPNTTLHPLLDSKGNEIQDELEDGLIITKSLQLLLGFQVGDNVTLEIGDEQETFKIVAMTEEYSGDKAYIHIEDLSQLLTDTDDYYNALYSRTEPNKDNYLVVISTEDIIEQADNMQTFFTSFILIMTVASIIIGAIIIYILTVMTIEDNFYNISLFKVIGFDEKEINKMILGGYTLYGVIIFIMAIPVAIGFFYLFQLIMGQYYSMIMPLEFVWWHAILSIVIFLVIFYIGAFAAKRKLSKVSLQEAMKMYQI